MTRKLLTALILIGLTVVILVVNSGSVRLSIGFTDFLLNKALVFLGFTAVGVLIGVLLK